MIAVRGAVAGPDGTELSMDAPGGPLEGVAEWTPGGLALTPAASARVARKRLSASSAQAVTSCAARFAVEKLVPSPPDPFSASELGTAAHAVFEDLYRLPAEERTVDAARDITRRIPVTSLLAVEAKAVLRDFARLDRPERTRRRLARLAVETGGPGLWELVEGVVARVDGKVGDRTVRNALRDMPGVHEIASPSPDSVARWVDEVDKRVVGLWKIEDPRRVDVWHTELRIDDWELSGVPFIGFVDRVDRGACNIPIVNDYKAGLSKPKPAGRYGDPHGEQLRLYAAAVAHRFGLYPGAARVLYTFHGVAREVNIAAKAAMKTTLRFRAAWETMSEASLTGVWPAKASPLCGWCPLALVCPTATAAGKDIARSDVARIGPTLGVGTAGMAVAADSMDHRSGPGSIKGQPQPAEVTADDERNSHMTVTDMHPSVFAPDEKPWVDSVDGKLNANSYAATAVFGTVELAVTSLTAGGVGLTPAAVDAMSATFARIVADAQALLGARCSYSDGTHTRLRGALRTALESLPAPFGADRATWEDWERRTLRRCVSIAKAAARLYEQDLPDTPWEMFVVEADSRQARSA